MFDWVVEEFGAGGDDDLVWVLEFVNVFAVEYGLFQSVAFELLFCRNGMCNTIPGTRCT